MSFAPLLDQFPGKRVLVVGDVMLDEYIFGRPTRISPEAPVMVMRHERSDRMPGGAANVAKNVAAFGASVHLIGVTGHDEGARLLLDALAEFSIPATLIAEEGRPTTRKTRMLAESRQQVLRIDREDDAPLKPSTEKELINDILERIDECDAVILSDYRKGCLSERIGREVHGATKTKWKPLIVNPKPASLSFYRGATVISLNRAEASEAIGLPVDDSNAEEVAQALRETTRAEAMVLTLGANGMVVAGPETFRISAPRVEVADPAGAGDTVVATVALGIASAGFKEDVFQLAARASACVVRHVGVATVSKEDLAELRS